MSSIMRNSGYTPISYNATPVNLAPITDLDYNNLYSSSTVNAMGDTADAASTGFLSSFNNWMKNSGVLSSYDKNTGIKTDGWGSLGLGAINSAANLIMGMKQYGLAKDQLNFQKDSFAKNYAAQRTSMNTQLEDRQRARVASNAGAYESVGSYMDKNRIA